MKWNGNKEILFEREFSMPIFAHSLKGHVKRDEKKLLKLISSGIFYPDNVFAFTLHSLTRNFYFF